MQRWFEATRCGAEVEIVCSDHYLADGKILIPIANVGAPRWPHMRDDHHRPDGCYVFVVGAADYDAAHASAYRTVTIPCEVSDPTGMSTCESATLTIVTVR